MVKARAEHPPIFNITYMASHSFAHLGWKQCCDSSSVSAWQEYWYTEHKKLSTWPIATHIRAAGSNLRIVRPSVVKLPIIHARSAQQNFGLAIFSSQEVLSLHFSFKLEVTINLLYSSGSLAVRNDREHKSYACELMYVPSQILQQQIQLGTRPHKIQTQTMSKLWLRMVQPWPDRFRCLCTSVTLWIAYLVSYCLPWSWSKESMYKLCFCAITLYTLRPLNNLLYSSTMFFSPQTSSLPFQTVLYSSSEINVLFTRH